MRTKKVAKIIRVVLFKEQADIIKKIEEGGNEFSSIVRNMISEYGKTHFPQESLYAVVQKERLELKKKTVEEQLAWDNMSPEEYAIKTLRARVYNGDAYFMAPNGAPYPIPLSKIKEYTVENNDFIKIHQTWMDGTFQWDNGIEKMPVDKEWNDKHINLWIGATGGVENNQNQYLEKK